MSTSDTAPTTKVVYNDEEQYSIWPADRTPPAGWYEDGFAGTQEECLAHIDEVWTDIRPRSVRELIAAQSRDSTLATQPRDSVPAAQGRDSTPATQPRDSVPAGTR